jgi:hypothetical protein
MKIRIPPFEIPINANKEHVTHLIDLCTVGDTVSSASEEQCSFRFIDMNLIND